MVHTQSIYTTLLCVCVCGEKLDWPRAPVDWQSIACWLEKWNFLFDFIGFWFFFFFSCCYYLHVVVVHISTILLPDHRVSTDFGRVWVSEGVMRWWSRYNGGKFWLRGLWFVRRLPPSHMFDNNLYYLLALKRALIQVQRQQQQRPATKYYTIGLEIIRDSPDQKEVSGRMSVDGRLKHAVHATRENVFLEALRRELYFKCFVCVCVSVRLVAQLPLHGEPSFCIKRSYSPASCRHFSLYRRASRQHFVNNRQINVRAVFQLFVFFSIFPLICTWPDIFHLFVYSYDN